MQRTTVNISTSTIFRIIFILLILLFIYAVRNILILLFFAVIIASAVDLIARHFDKLKIPRSVSVLIIYLVVAALIIGLFVLLVPSLAKEIKSFSNEFPAYAEKLHMNFQHIQNSSIGYQKVISEIQKTLGSWSNILHKSVNNLLAGTLDIFGGLVSFIILIVISFYLAIQKDGIQNFLKVITPHEYEAYVLNLWKRSEKKMGQWLQGQLLLALIVGIMVYIGLWLFHIRFAFLLAVLASILELVPYAGPVLAAVPAVIIAFIQHPVLALWIIVLYIAIQQTENHLLEPIVIGKAVGLNPVVVIIALLIGGELLGILGVILAVPVAAILAEFFKDIKAS